MADRFCFRTVQHHDFDIHQSFIIMSKKALAIIGTVLAVLAVVTFVLRITGHLAIPFGGWIPAISLALAAWAFNAYFQSGSSSGKSSANAGPAPKAALKKTGKDAVNWAVLQNMMIVGAKDGKIGDDEFTCILMLMNQRGMEVEDVIEAMKVLDSQPLTKLVIPDSFEEKDRQLSELSYLVLIDGKATKAEKDYVKSIAVKFGFSEEAAEKAVETAIKKIRNDEGFKIFKESVKKGADIIRENMPK